MKAEELRIGNWINGFEGIPVMVNKNTIWNWDETIEPIPITEEWLEMFGFEWDKARMIFTEQIYSIERLSDGGMFFNYDTQHEIAKIKYVHQLQNLYFALTNTELKLSEKQVTDMKKEKITITFKIDGGGGGLVTGYSNKEVFNNLKDAVLGSLLIKDMNKCEKQGKEITNNS